MTSPPMADRPPASPSPRKGDADLLRAAQSILFARERERIRALEEEIAARREAEAQVAALQEQVVRLEEKLRETERRQEDHLLDLQTSISILNYKNFGKSESLLSRLAPVFSRLIGQRIEEDRDEMARAFSPIMGQAIRTQIRNSRQDMIDALYPIIGAVVQRSVADTLREIQRNIDARLRQTSGIALRSLRARLSGVSQSELTLRDAIPFCVRQMFLIQHGTGLLLVSYPAEDTELSSGLIGGMLTAIRQFARDSFGHSQTDTELDEIQYGDERIIIQSGQHVYLAVVLSGVEPEGFHAQLREFVSELHVQHEVELRGYDGDPDTLPPLQPKLAGLTDTITTDAPDAPNPLSRAQKLIAFILGMGGLLLLALACFYMQFTIALLPLAFPGPSPTATITMAPSLTATLPPTATAMPSATPTLTPTATATATMEPTTTPQSSPTNTAVPTTTATPTITPEPTATKAPTITPTPISALMIGHVYALSEPQLFTPRAGLVLKDTAVVITAVYDTWAKIEWTDESGVHNGWILLKWIELREPIPAYLITPTVVNR
ncbi:MAG: hypothetical protein GY803_21745 [Chloroflexi bacterium]|nr:hypothetical protein [Chloroflexota bacterium]